GATTGTPRYAPTAGRETARPRPPALSDVRGGPLALVETFERSNVPTFDDHNSDEAEQQRHACYPHPLLERQPADPDVQDVIQIVVPGAKPYRQRIPGPAARQRAT